MKRLLILLCLFAAIGVQAQGCLKGTVTDAKTGEPLPFINVTVFQDGKQVHSGVTDWDGLFTIKPLPEGKYDVLISYIGYLPYKKEGVKILATGFTMLDIKLTPAATWQSSVSQEPKMLPLLEYEVADSGLAMLLVRVIEGKENTYFWREEPLDPRPSAPGSSYNLYLFTPCPIDTTNPEDYLNMLHSEDSTLPRPLTEKAPRFSFDSTNTSLSITTTRDSMVIYENAVGYVEYRGRIFFLYYPVEDSTFLRRHGDKERSFKCHIPKGPIIEIWDPETWIYTKQQGHWYRWMEFPRGF